MGEPMTPTGKRLAADWDEHATPDIIAAIEAEAAAQERERLREALCDVWTWQTWDPPRGTELSQHSVYMDRDVIALLAEPPDTT